MSIPIPSFLSENLHLEMLLPLRWRRLSESETVASFTAQNILALQFIEAAQEHTNTVTEKADTRHGDLHRIEQRLDLILSLVGQLLAQQTNPPAAQTVLLGMAGVCWQENSPPPPAEQLLIELFLHPRTNPLCLKATVAEVLNSNNHMYCVVRFAKVEQTLHELMEKWIFRQHRLAVAQARRSR